jgi:hypothetical protein
VIGHVRRAAGKLPDQPAVDRAAQQFAVCDPLLDGLIVIDQPADLGGRDIRHDYHAGAGLDIDLIPGDQFLAQRPGALILPDDGAAHRLACFFIPEYSCIALIGDANGVDLFRSDAAIPQGLGHYLQTHFPDLLRVVFHPAQLRKVLSDLGKGRGDDICLSVEDHRPGANGALVNA